MFKNLCFMGVLLFASVAEAREIVPGPVVCEVISVYDGDTFTCITHPWPGLRVETSVRPNGFDAPELRGKCEKEKQQALISKGALSLFLSVGVVNLRNIFFGKWAGRVVADVYIDETPLTKLMITGEFARPYSGGKRLPWCEKEKENV